MIFVFVGKHFEVSTSVNRFPLYEHVRMYVRILILFTLHVYSEYMDPQNLAIGSLQCLCPSLDMIHIIYMSYPVSTLDAHQAARLMIMTHKQGF